MQRKNKQNYWYSTRKLINLYQNSTCSFRKPKKKSCAKQVQSQNEENTPHGCLV